MDDEEKNESAPKLNESGKSALENAEDLGNKAHKLKGLWEKLKSFEALAPLVSAIGAIALALLIIFLVIGYIAFFISMPGLFVNKFVNVCKSFWHDIIIADESIHVDETKLVDLANYIEDLGYDLEAFGFATKGSIVREDLENNESSTGKRGKITSLNLSKSENTNNTYMGMINMLTFALTDDAKLEMDEETEELIYPVGVLDNTNIINIVQNGNSNFYKAISSTGTNISFFRDNGTPIKYNISFDTNGTPIFTEDSNGYTYNELLNGKTINGITVKVDGISYNDYVRLFNNKKLTDDITLKNQAKYLDEYINFLAQYDISSTMDMEIDIWASLSPIEGIMEITENGGNIKEIAESIILRAHMGGINLTPGEFIIARMLEENQNSEIFRDERELFRFVKNASIALKNLDTKMVESAALKNQNLYAYVLANERTFTAKNVKRNVVQDTVQKVLGWIPGVRDITVALNHEVLLNRLMPQGFGMLVFNDNAFTNRASAEKGDFDVTINRDDNSMIITTTTNTGFLQWRSDQMKWNLSGWTSRYGKPIELSLALHLSTMAPDFVYDFCMDKDLQTQVLLNTQEVTYNINYKYETSNNSVIYGEDKTDDAGNKIEGVITIGDRLESKQSYINTDKYIFNVNVKIGDQVIVNGKEHIHSDCNVLNPEIDYNKYYPLEIFNGTNIIAVTVWRENSEDGLEDVHTCNFFKAVDKDGKPVRIFDDNGNYIPYKLKWKNDNRFATIF